MPRIAGVVILYYPDSDLQARIETYLGPIDRLYVIDNSEKPQSFAFSSSKIVYYSDQVNKGIAARLNQAAQMAIGERFDWLLTMDQDSYFANDNFLNFLECIETYSERHNVAVFGTQYINSGLQSSTCNAVAINQLITSGSMLNLTTFPLIGDFDEALFIDQVDSEYCYRAILKNYKIIRFNNIYLQHSLGEHSTHRSLKNLKKTKRSLHSPLRLYYMTRNYFYVQAKYKTDFPAEVAELKKDLLMRIKNNFLYSSQRFSLLKHVFSGIMDYKRNKMGEKK